MTVNGKELAMKKIIILLLTVSMIAAAFVGCADKPDSNKPDSEKLPSDGFGLTSEDTNGNWLRDDVELKILKYKYGKKVDPQKCSLRYFGSYNDMPIISVYYIIEGGFFPGVVEYETIADLKFAVPNGRQYCVWVNDELHYLKDAYELGILTADDIKNIHQRHTTMHHFYGPYNGAIVWQSSENGCPPDTIKYENIAGLQFRFTGHMKIQVICDNGFCGLNEAYESGILTADDIEAFYSDYLNARYYHYR